ncbi:MAG: tetratricopeptide repeat protein [Pseudomonadales bacterium]
MAQNPIANFYEELKRRRVIRVATLYVVAIWPIIQLLDIISPTLNLPESVLRYLVIAFFAGLPFALILAWMFDLDKDGVHLDDGEAHQPLLGSKADMTIVGVLCVLVVGLFFVQVALEDEPVADAGVVATDGLQPDPAPALAHQEPVLANSIAVKPFDSFSVDPSDQFFADGLSEELLNVLARVPELHVAARTSSFAYKGVNRNISEIGRELNVANILEGSIRVNDVDNSIRVTAQLIDVATGGHIWSETYTRQYNDVFRIQDEISAAVAEKLKVTLVGEKPGGGQGDVVRTTNPEVLVAYGRGQQELAKRNKASLAAAADYFHAAIDADPNFALAYTGLADALTLNVSYEFGDRDSQLQAARVAVDKALSLDANLGIAWASLGLLESQFSDRIAEARSALERAMTLNPSYAMAVMWYASLEEDKSKKMTLYERAVELDPKSPVAAYNLAQMYSAQGRDAEVMRLFSQMVEADPSYPHGYELAGQVSVRSGQIGEAIRYYKKAYELRDDDVNLALNIGKLYADIGELESSDLWFEKVLPIVPDEYYARVLWFRIGRYVAGGDMDKVDALLDEIKQPRTGDLEDDYDRILANYYQGNTATLVADYRKAEQSGRTIGNDDEYAAGLRVRVWIAVANQLYATENIEEAEVLLSQAEDALQNRLNDPGRYWAEDRYYLARIHAIRGEDQLALIQLQRAVDEGWREHWRPSLDPAMANLQSERFFTTMMAGWKEAVWRSSVISFVLRRSLPWVLKPRLR